jgi:transposase-like protein
MSGRNGMLHYEIETKKEAVRLFLEEHYTYSQITKKVGYSEEATNRSLGSDVSTRRREIFL